MTESSPDYRRYFDPRVLARVGALELRARLIVEGLMTGMHRSPYQGVSVEFAQHRPYAPGDDIRHVDWKVLAKTDRIYLKQYQEETNLQLVLVVDASQSMTYSSMRFADGAAWSKYDHATAIAATLAYLCIGQQDAVGLAIFDQELRRHLKPSNLPGQWKQIVQELMQGNRKEKTGIGRILEQLAEKITHRSLLVIVSDFFDDLAALQRGLRHLRHRKHEVIALQVLDPAELSFPFDDPTLFEGLEATGSLLTDPISLRRSYLDNLNRATTDLRKSCRGLNIDFRQMSSGEALDVALAGFLATRAASMR
jgi:uncharacterized protein (DUF58 family)